MLVVRNDKTPTGVKSNYGVLDNREVKLFDGSYLKLSEVKRISLSNEVLFHYVESVDQLIVYEKDNELFKVYHGSLIPEVGYLVDTVSRKAIVSGDRLTLDGNNYQGILETLSEMTDKGFPALNPSNLSVYLNGVKQDGEEVDSRLLSLWTKYVILNIEKER